MNICCEQVRSIEESNKLLSYPPAYCNRLTRHAATIQQKISPQKPPATTENQSFSSIHSSTINISSRGYSADIPAKGPPVQKNTQQKKEQPLNATTPFKKQFGLLQLIEQLGQNRFTNLLHQLCNKTIKPISKPNFRQTILSGNLIQR